MLPTAKITQLPRPIQIELNRRLQAGEAIPQLVAWLNSLPPDPAAPSPGPGEKTRFRDEDLSAWAQTGHRDWLAHQSVLAAVRELAAEVRELVQAGEGALTEMLSQFLTGQYAMAVRAAVQQAACGVMDLKVLKPLCSDLMALRRGDQNAESLRLQRERLDIERSEDAARALGHCLDDCKQWPEVEDAFRGAFQLLREHIDSKS